jgi:hypothetical protein
MSNDLPNGGAEPTQKEIEDYMKDSGLDHYNAREFLRECTYGGTPPDGYSSWGDYWKSF